ncbi:MAG: hypothetical protein GDA48_16395 [Hormoscilla sp. GM102CHS1]|nr:hypothetical protein [Hormoscilla sp. SP12CHS1]MBC6474188.1 hypothetical protein [Hormoscilla sp. GM102CHS1]
MSIGANWDSFVATFVMPYTIADTLSVVSCQLSVVNCQGVAGMIVVINC